MRCKSWRRGLRISARGKPCKPYLRVGTPPLAPAATAVNESAMAAPPSVTVKTVGIPAIEATSPKTALTSYAYDNLFDLFPLA